MARKSRSVGKFSSGRSPKKGRPGLGQVNVAGTRHPYSFKGNQIKALRRSIPMTGGSRSAEGGTLLNPFPVLAAQAWSPLQIDSCRAIFAPAFERYAFQERASTDVCATHADDATEALGTFVDFSIGAHLWEATGSANRPTLRDSGAVRYAEFDGSNDNVLLQNGSSLIEDMLSNRRGTVAVRFRVPSGGDSTQYNLLDCAGGTGANNGFIFQRRTTGILRMNFTDGGSNAFDTTDTVVNADGFVTVVVRWDVANGVGITVDGGTEATASIFTAITGDVTNELSICNREAGTGPQAGEVQWVVLCKDRVSDSELASLNTWDPATNTDRMIFGRDDADGFGSMLNRYYDFLDATTLDDGAGGTPALAAGVDSVAHKVDSALGRAAQADASGDRPTRRSYGLQFDGTDDNFSVEDLNMNVPSTIIIVCDNDDDTDGSHWVSSSVSRILSTGDNYTGNAAANGVAYSLVHPSAGSTAGVDLVTETGWNILEVRRDGSSWNQTVTGQNSADSTNANTCVFTDIGDFQPALSDWQADGKVAAILHFHEYLTDDEIAYIRQQLVAQMATAGETVPTA